MKYRDGEEVSLGDKVRLWDNCFGVVVSSLDTNEFSSEYKKEDWSHLGEGILVMSDKGGLIHYKFADEDFAKLA